MVHCCLVVSMWVLIILLIVGLDFSSIPAVVTCCFHEHETLSRFLGSWSEETDTGVELSSYVLPSDQIKMN